MRVVTTIMAATAPAIKRIVVSESAAMEGSAYWRVTVWVERPNVK